MPLNLPILLTWLRIAAIPLLIATYYLPGLTLAQANLVATLIFVIAAITDWADGFLARRLNQTSAFGAFLDPVADKLMVCAALVLLVELERIGGLIAFIIIGREIAVSALREWMAQIGASKKSIAVSMLGKAKTTVQMIAIPMLLLEEDVFGLNLAVLGRIAIGIAAILTIVSMAYYLRKAWTEIRQSRLGVATDADK